MAALPQKLQQATKQTIQQTARTIAQNVKNETHETLKSTKEQLGLPQNELPQQRETQTQVPGVVNEIKEAGVENVNREAIRAWEQSRIGQLEQQLLQMQQRRKQEEEAYSKEQEQKMQVAASAVQTQETVAPQGKVKKALGAAKKKVQSIISNRKQQESKAGSGKG